MRGATGNGVHVPQGGLGSSGHPDRERGSRDPACQEPSPDAARDDPVRGCHRRLDRQHRTALDRPRAEVLTGRPLVGGQCLHADVRWLPAAGWAPRRPHGTPAHVHVRPDPLLGRLAARRPRAVGGVADRRTRPAGPRRRDRLAGGPVDHHDDVRRRTGAQSRARRVGRGGGRRRRGGRSARRRPHERAELALGPVRQRADRGAVRLPCAAHPAREPRRGREPQLRRTRRGDGHGGTRAARLFARRRRQRRLGLDGDDPSPRRRGGAADRLRGDRATPARAAGCPPRSSGCEPYGEQMSSRC